MSTIFTANLTNRNENHLILLRKAISRVDILVLVLRNDDVFGESWVIVELVGVEDLEMSELMLFNIKVYDGSTQNILSHKDQRDSKYPKVCIILLSFKNQTLPQQTDRVSLKHEN